MCTCLFVASTCLFVIRLVSEIEPYYVSITKFIFESYDNGGFVTPFVQGC